jgi:tetratricopeptide (TPR) repeat protein
MSPTSEPDAAAPMTLDRAAVLRNAQKLLRIGKLGPAIKLYEQVVRESPEDLQTAASLGNLYVRAGSPEKAMDLFLGIANGLRSRGLHAQAAVAYQRVLAVSDDNEQALLQLAEIASSQNQNAEARAYLTRVEDRRRGRGDSKGAAQILIQIAELDPHDFDARLAAARARQETGDNKGAIADFKRTADDLLEGGRHAEAATVLKEAAQLVPDDAGLAERLFDAYLLAGNFAEARNAARTSAHWKRLATTLIAVDDADALDVLREAASRQPDDLGLQASLARRFVEEGDAVAAAAHLRPEMAEDNPAILLAIAEIQLRGGQADKAVELVRRSVTKDYQMTPDVSALALRASGAVPETAWTLMQLAVDGWAKQSELATAASALEEFVARVPDSTPALIRLVEVAIDGDLPDVASRAQAQLADAYLKSGDAAEALVIIEDLATRERDNPAHIERFRQALLALGESDLEGAITRRLNANLPFGDDGSGF